MSDGRELNLLRDSNTMMRQREAQREADTKAAEEKVATALAQIEPLAREKVLKERECQTLAGQVEQLTKESKQWQERVRKFLAKDRATVGMEAHELQLEANNELKKEMEAQRADAKKEMDTLKAEKEKVEGELAAAQKLESRLRKSGGQFRESANQKEKELEEERSAKTALEEQLREAKLTSEAAREEKGKAEEQVAAQEKKMAALAEKADEDAKQIAKQNGELLAANELSTKYMKGFVTAKASLMEKLKELTALKGGSSSEQPKAEAPKVANPPAAASPASATAVAPQSAGAAAGVAAPMAAVAAAAKGAGRGRGSPGVTGKGAGRAKTRAVPPAGAAAPVPAPVAAPASAPAPAPLAAPVAEETEGGESSSAVDADVLAAEAEAEVRMQCGSNHLQVCAIQPCTCSLRQPSPLQVAETAIGEEVDEATGTEDAEGTETADPVEAPAAGSKRAATSQSEVPARKQQRATEASAAEEELPDGVEDEVEIDGDIDDLAAVEDE